MPMHDIIKEKRKELALTQEQIAEYLGVSTPAVNKWEKGSTYPDMTLLPSLARLLKTDLNTLLCFNEKLTDKEIGNFCNEVITKIRTSDYETGFNMVMKKIQEYPNCYSLINMSALTLEGALMMYGSDLDDKEMYHDKITSLYERVTKCDDEKIRNEAVYMLALTYINENNFEKAEQMINLLPPRITHDKMSVQAKLYIVQEKHDEASEILERKLLMNVSEIQSTILQLIGLYIKKDSIEDASRLAMLHKNVTNIFELWEYTSYVAPLEVALAKKDVNSSLSLIKSILTELSKPWDIKNTFLYPHIATKSKNDTPNTDFLPAILNEMKKSPQYDFLRSHPEFQQIVGA